MSDKKALGFARIYIVDLVADNRLNFVKSIATQRSHSRL